MINEDWALDVRKYAPDADDGIIAGIVRYCGIALRKVDSSLVAFSDPKETARMRDGYCRKKLGLTQSDADVDAAIAAVGARMQADRTKNRVTVYYLLAEHFGKLDLFAPKAKTGARTAAAAGAAVAATAMGAAAASAEANGATASSDVPPPAAPPPPVVPAATVETAPVAPAVPVEVAPVGLMSEGTGGAMVTGGATAAAGAAAAVVAAPSLAKANDDNHASAGPGWTQPRPVEPNGGFMFGAVGVVIGAVIVAALIAWFISSRMGGEPYAGAPVVAAAPAPAAPVTPAPAAPTPPEGSGVTATEVAGRPLVSVYFDSGSALIASDFATVAAPIKAWLDANPGDMAQVSGFNDPTGTTEFNADLSRRRAEGVAAELRSLGVPDNQIDLEPPASATDASTNLAGARRVEITVVPLN